MTLLRDVPRNGLCQYRHTCRRSRRKRTRDQTWSGINREATQNTNRDKPMTIEPLNVRKVNCIRSHKLEGDKSKPGAPRKRITRHGQEQTEHQ